MQLWTIQMAKWREARDLNIHLLDTTVKSGVRVFAPTWEIVLGVKSGSISEETYTQEYLRLMRNSFRSTPRSWLDVCAMNEVAIACYCPAGKFCHRHLLADMFEKLCKNKSIPFIMKGELGVKG